MGSKGPHPEKTRRIAGRISYVAQLTVLTILVLLATTCNPTRTPTVPGPTPPASADAQTVSGGARVQHTNPFAGQAISFRRLTLEDGLSQSTINCITQDAQGFMWFGTQDGINRFDGYTFKVYRHDPEDPNSLSNDFILGCECDQRGVMWVVTREGTLHRYELETDRFVRYPLALEDPFQLAGSEFTTLHGDEQGRLWIGTQGDGLIRYNPEEDEFTYYRHDPEDPISLSHRIVYRVVEDHQGVIWVGTEGGLNRYVPESDDFVRYPYRDFPAGAYQYDPPVHTEDPAFQPDNPHALASPAVTAILEDQENRLWIGTRYGGLNRLDRATDHFVAYPFDPADEPENPHTFSGNSVRQLVVDQEGYLWVSSAHWNLDETRTYARLGLEQLDPETGTITRFQADPDDPCALPHQAIWRMYEDRRGTLWVHTFAGGVDVYHPETGCFVHHAHDPDDDKTLSGNDLTAFYEDTANGLWIGTAHGGISRYDPTWAKFPIYHVSAASDERMSNDSIWRFAPSAPGIDEAGRTQALWVATFAGLNYWDRIDNTFTFYEIDPDLPDIIAYAIYEDTARGTLWLGTTMGLERVTLPPDGAGPPLELDTTRILTRTSSSRGLVTDLYPAGDDQVWMAHYQIGLSRFDLAREVIVATFQVDPENDSSLSDDRLMDIAPGQDGTLWVTTRSGIEHFNPATGGFTPYRHDPDDPQSVAERVLALYQDDEGTVWLGTEGAGLQRFDPELGQVTTHYGEAEGLPNNVVYSIVPDETGHLWLSTNKGLTQFNPEAETFQTYTVQDGLQSNEFNLGAHVRAPDGELFFGGVDGINAFYPANVHPNPYVPPVVITEILLGPPQPPLGTTTASGATQGRASQTILESPPHIAERIQLSYRDRILSFEFAALHYALPERNQYAYKMEGFDKDWSYAGNRRFATYTNLPPGTYTFRVKGTNSDGVWNEVGTSLAVVVKPPFWATWWFRGLIGTLVIGGVITGYRMRVKTIEARSQELEKQVAERTRELSAVNAISAVVSHSLDLDVMLVDALDETLSVMAIEAGGIYILDQANGLLTIAAQRGFSPGLIDAIDRLRVGEGFSGRVAQSGKALVVRDISADSRLTRSAVMDEGLHSLASVPLQAKGEILGTLFTVTRGYRTFTDRDIDLLTAIGHQIGVAVENANLYQDTRDRLAQLTALQETAMAVASTLELGRLLRLIVQQATSLLQADSGILNLVDWDAGEDEVVAEIGSAASSVGNRSSLQGSLSGWATLHKQTVTLNDPSTDDRVDQLGLAALEGKKGTPIGNAAVAPLTIRERAIGSLVLLDKQKGQDNFSQNDLDLLQTFANQAATAIENARLYEQAQRLAVVEERQRLARELHDSVTQALYGVTLYAEATTRQLASGETALAGEYLHELRDTAQEALREMRLLIFELRPSILETEGLVTALRARLESVEERAGRETQFTRDGETPLPAEVEEGLYRIAQEALNNALKHANAQNVSVNLSRSDDMVVLEIADDGIGFDADVAINNGGLGLDGMKERAAQIGGSLVLDSRPGKGTRVRVEVRQ